MSSSETPEPLIVQKLLEDARDAMRELRLADGHANRTGDEVRFDRAFAQVCALESRITEALASLHPVYEKGDR